MIVSNERKNCENLNFIWAKAHPEYHFGGGGALKFLKISSFFAQAPKNCPKFSIFEEGRFKNFPN